MNIEIRLDELPIAKFKDIGGRSLNSAYTCSKEETDRLVFTGDTFIHKRTGREYTFYHDSLGTRIELIEGGL